MNASEIVTDADFAQSSDSDRGLPERMILYVYRVAGIASAQQISFWEEFRIANPDIEMQAQDLRAMFFVEVLSNSQHYEHLGYTVVQYLNPIFNRYHTDNLEFGDMTEGKDFLLDTPKHAIAFNLNSEEMSQYISAPFTASHNLSMPPLHLESIPHPEIPLSQKDDREPFAQALSELVRTQEGAAETTEPSITELKNRVLSLTEAKISLQNIAEPGMKAYDLLKSCQMIRCDGERPDDQVVPLTSVFQKDQSSIKRSRSVDDSGIVLSPSKRARIIPSKSRQLRLRRLLSAPADS